MGFRLLSWYLSISPFSHSMKFDDILYKSNETVSEAARQLRSVIIASYPDIMEDPRVTPKMEYAFYHIGPKNNPVCMIQPAGDHCKLYIHHFGEVVLRGFHLYGTGKNARHLRFFDWKEAERNSLISLLADIVAITASRV